MTSSASPRWLASLSRGALAHASGFGWPATADRLIEVYTGAMASAGSAGSVGRWPGLLARGLGARVSGDPAADVEAALRSLELGFEQPRPGAFLVKLEGQHKLATMTWLVVGEHSLGVEAFFCRQPDENHEAFYRFLLERNGRMYGVHFTLDQAGDVYLTGRLPLSSVSADGHRPAARLRAQLLRRELRRGARARLRFGHPAGMGLAGQARREPGQPAGVRAVRRPRPLDRRQ